MAHLWVCNLGRDFAGDGPDPLLHVLAQVVGMVFDGGGWQMGSRCVSGLVNVVWFGVRAFVMTCHTAVMCCD
jgi:hypothetical protein